MQSAIFQNLAKVLKILEKESRAWARPIAGTFVGEPNAAFRILISTVLSLRTKDTTTGPASRRLFAIADTPEEMLKLSAAKIEKIIYPVGFYRTKAKNILKICQILLNRFEGSVSDDIEELLTLPGVGRKTANLVVTVGFGKPGICVDTHVHRISNRWGIIRTKTPEETEFALRKILPVQYWVQFNDQLVSYGQNLCVPVSPFCSRCQIASLCPKINVSKSR
jgi:endonuclease-3